MKLISVVSPCYNEERNVVELYRQIKAIFNKFSNYNYEHIFIDNASSDDSSEFMKEMLKLEIECKRPVFKPLHEYLGLSGCNVAQEVMDRAVSIPLYPSLKDEEAHKIVGGIVDRLKVFRL